MSLKQVRLFIMFGIWFSLPVNILNANAGCRAIFEESTTGLKYQKISPTSATYSVTVEHEKIDVIIEMLLVIQKSHLVNQMDPKAVSTQNGFLVTEMTPEDVKDLLKEGEILAVCRGPVPNDEFAGYIILSSLSGLEKYTQQYDLTLSIPRNEWDEFMRNKSHQYIEQIAVSREYARSGVGIELLQASQTISPTGIMAAILFEPYNNLASYSLFTSKGHFRDVGSLDLKKYPKFRALKSHMMMWDPGQR